MKDESANRPNELRLRPKMSFTLSREECSKLAALARSKRLSKSATVAWLIEKAYAAMTRMTP